MPWWWQAHILNKILVSSENRFIANSHKSNKMVFEAMKFVTRRSKSHQAKDEQSDRSYEVRI